LFLKSLSDLVRSLLRKAVAGYKTGHGMRFDLLDEQIFAEFAVGARLFEADGHVEYSEFERWAF
jgi:hypothetical protein